MKEQKQPSHAMLTFLFALIVFIILVITMLIASGVTFLLTRAGVVTDIRVGTSIIFFISGIFAVTSVLVGTVIAAIISRIPLQPFNRLISGLKQLASGDYDVRIDMGNRSVVGDIADNFNILASELQNTEMLRSEFINNFSHEFKTPIVSIRGFTQILQKGNLSDEQQQEYLDIIAEESSRLADMATNVLNLTKVENQSILTDISHFNLSEQIRNSILLLEAKWTQKDLAVIADYDEYDIDANEELLKQVWINLLDNAVKFSPKGGEIGVSITQNSDKTVVSISNSGPEISTKDQKHIFNKFWPGDTSHASQGTGIGLSIAKRITELHRGGISISSTMNKTVFSVELPSR